MWLLRMKRERPSSVRGPRAVTTLFGIGDTLFPVVRVRWGRIAESAEEAMVARLNAHSRLTLHTNGGRVTVRLSACPWDCLVLLQYACAQTCTRSSHIYIFQVLCSLSSMNFSKSFLAVPQKLRPSSVLLMERSGLTFFSPTARGRLQHVCWKPRWPSVALSGPRWPPVPACSQSLRGPGFVCSTNSTLSLNSAQLVTVDQ